MTNDKQFNPQGATCRNCGNTGVGFTGAPCPCTVKYSNPKPRYADVLKQENEALKSENARLQAELKEAKPWQLFYGQGFTLGQVAEILGGSIYDYSPWLTSPGFKAARTETFNETKLRTLNDSLLEKNAKLQAQLDAANLQLQGAREAINKTMLHDWYEKGSLLHVDLMDADSQKYGHCFSIPKSYEWFLEAIMEAKQALSTLPNTAKADAIKPMSIAEHIYSFAAMLTCREESVTLSAYHNAAPAAELAAEYCKRHGLVYPSRQAQEQGGQSGGIFN